MRRLIPLLLAVSLGLSGCLTFDDNAKLAGLTPATPLADGAKLRLSPKSDLASDDLKLDPACALSVRLQQPAKSYTFTDCDGEIYELAPSGNRFYAVEPEDGIFVTTICDNSDDATDCTLVPARFAQTRLTVISHVFASGLISAQLKAWRARLDDPSAQAVLDQVADRNRRDGALSSGLITIVDEEQLALLTRLFLEQPPTGAQILYFDIE